MLHISTAWSYWCSTRAISGALYHLEYTWLDKHRRFSVYSSSFILISFFMTIFLLWASSISLAIEFLKIAWRILLEFPEPFSRRLTGKVRDIPKSHSLTWQSLVTKIFAGFKSRCMTFAEWKNFIAHNKLYTINLMCSLEISVKTPDLRTVLKSASRYSMTKNKF